MDILFRPYIAADRHACIDVFGSNVPDFFALEESADFLAFLDNLPGPYHVLEHQGTIAGCDGWAFSRKKPNQAVLCWGMIRRCDHRAGLGSRLLENRLAEIRKDPHITEVVVNASQHSGGFFSKFDFNIREITPNGYAVGIDRWKMVKTLRPAPLSSHVL